MNHRAFKLEMTEAGAECLEVAPRQVGKKRAMGWGKHFQNPNVARGKRLEKKMGESPTFPNPRGARLTPEIPRLLSLRICWDDGRSCYLSGASGSDFNFSAPPSHHVPLDVPSCPIMGPSSGCGSPTCGSICDWVDRCKEDELTGGGVGICVPA